VTINGGTIDTSGTTDESVLNVNPIVVAGDFGFGGTGNLTLPGAVTIDGARTLTINGTSGKALTFSNAITNGTSVGALTKAGPGTLRLSGSNSYTGPTTVQAGRLQLANSAALGSSKLVPLAGGTVTLTPGLQTTVGGLAPNAGGLVDVSNGLVTVASGLSATDLVTAIVAGRGDGSWTGTSGITSSVAATDVAVSIPRAVGWLDNGDGSVTAAFAAPGDTNLDWQVDVLDASNFLSFGKYDTGLPATWLEGDFNYDGVVDVLDASDFFGTGLYDTGNYNTASGSVGAVAAVPEPSTWAVLTVMLTAGLVARLRRRG
jgi:autotransporter-associated beta strand protein